MEHDLNAKQTVCRIIDQSRDKLAQLTSEMVRFPSTFGQEEDIQQYIADRLEKMGAEVDFWYPDIEQMRKHPGFCSDRTDFSTSPNVCGVFKGSGDGKSLILNGHVDVVPPGNEDDWSDSPWSGKITQDRVWGRGSTDMKGGLACNFIALEAIWAAGLTLNGDILFQTVMDEECGGMGTLAQIVRGYRADGVLIPECMKNNVVIATIGSAWVRLTVPGRGALLSNAEAGASAIEKSAYIFNRLNEFERERTQRLAHPLLSHVKTPFKINVGTIKAGNWPSAVPDQSVMEIRYGMSPLQTVDEAKAEFEDYIDKISQGDPWLKDHRPQIEWLGCCWHPCSIDPNHPLVRLVADNHRDVTGEDAVVCGAAGGADNGSYARFLNIPAILYGPGEISVGHQANEYIEIDKMMDATKVIASTILDWCGYSSNP